ncbi:MAG: alpha/beta fold hydrolase [Janthinobacterium lividum]
MHAKLNGVDTRYLLSSEGTAGWLTFIHPLGGDLSVWDQLAAAFAEHFRVLRYDLRGHGPMGDGNPFSIADLAADLRALLDRCHVPRTHIVGLSMGALVAQEFALTYPTRVGQLALCDALTDPSDAARQAFAARAATVRQHGMAPLVAPLLDHSFSMHFSRAHPEATEQVHDVLAATDPAGYAAGCDALAAFDGFARFSRITAPTLVVTGKEYAGTSAAAAALPVPASAPSPAAARSPASVIESIPVLASAQRLLLPGAHLAAIEDPGRFAAALLDFLSAGGAMQAP